MEDPKRIVISGGGIPVRGNDIDTDRIIPARFLKTVVFDGLGEHAFEDDRGQLREAGKTHSFDEPKFQGARVLVVNKNFGCGSSREHAPQAIVRWGKGIRAIVGESFAEIFFGNCVSLGLPCVTVDEKTASALQTSIEQNPAAEVSVDLASKTVKVGGASYPITMPDGPRKQLMEGRWDSTAELVGNRDIIKATAAKLPYFTGFV
ncbi:MAG TPA: 3-isopropylmalate dehydratase small subunit [Polyangiaceae bacterium]|jgi:3-isopropylmalate/(R)-2-methylmalate dehydratase small subunit|nr:3-isopropylmalate dehydratase small subunit [Polyangiaceae bacterium]